MKKIKMSMKTLVYPMPAFLVGSVVDGRPNFLTVAWSGIACGEPPMISVSIRTSGRYSYAAIRQNGVFSVNVPSVDMVKQTDYCGIVSGAKVDKAKECGFNIFYGALQNAPLIEECPVNLVCSVVHNQNLGSHDIFIGKIEETYVSEECLTDGKPDVHKIKPFSYSIGHTQEYLTLGESIGTAWNIGKRMAI